MTDADFPLRMEFGAVVIHEAERISLVIRVGEGTCPHCAWGPVRAEAGARGFCPSCAGPILAVLPAVRS